MLAAGDMSGSWTLQVWFEGLSSPLELTSTSPTGTVSVGGVNVFASGYVQASTLDRVTGCTATPDSSPDSVGYVVLSVPC
jgi:hypothetical protein